MSHALEELLDRLEHALGAFEAAAVNVSGATFQRQGMQIVAAQLGETAADVVTAGRMIAAVQPSAIAATAREKERVSRLGTTDWTLVGARSPELAELRTSVKAWFVFVSAFCDNLYRILLAVRSGWSAPEGGTMSTALKNESNSVAVILDERLSDFLPWFRSLRDKRNRVKAGINFGTTELGGPGIGVVFSRVTSEGGLSVDLSGHDTVTLSDVIEAIELLTNALGVVADVCDRPPSAA